MLSTISMPLWITILAGLAIFVATILIGRRACVHGAACGPSNNRVLRRFRIRAKANMHLIDDGKPYVVHARIGDISDNGAGIVSPIEFAPGAAVCIEIPNLHLAATARIRTCNKRWWSYRVGVEFTGPLFRSYGTQAADAVCFMTMRADR